MARQVNCTAREDGYTVTFDAMASPCEVLIDSSDADLAAIVGQEVAKEAWRIEDKYSRYQSNSVCGQLNAKAGQKCAIDQETYQLLQFAEHCYQLSEGLFDITSGVLRKVWQFDGSDNVPSQHEIDEILPFVGWRQVAFDQKYFQMQPNMEIDFGGLGKEYAVDKALMIAAQTVKRLGHDNIPLLVNFGGDLAVNGPRRDQSAWLVGVEHPSLEQQSAMIVQISHGAVATSGDAKRFLLKHGKRYGHVLNVNTGWPVENSPKSITVAAPQCIQAGLLATLALLQGEDAGTFLHEQAIKHWLIQ